MKKPDTFHKRLPKFEPFDEVHMRVVPRLKESELSGDEWRTSVLVEFKFKGVIVHEFSVSDMQIAALMLGHHLIVKTEPIPEKVIELERLHCDQPGCHNRATVELTLREEFSDRGEKLDPGDRYGKPCRRFCPVHSSRGDCSREDCDANVEHRVALPDPHSHPSS